MGHVVELQKIKLRLDAKIDKDVAVSMKVAKCILEESKCWVWVDGILGEVQEVQESTGRTNESGIADVVGQPDVDDDTQKKTTDLVMFLTGDLREAAYALGEDTDVVIWWQTMAPCVDFCGLTGFEYPRFEVFDDTLV